ncbi:MAG TPA: response regulator, partial [Vicinamibacterales bacterium]|nr:response regulator [Vicinamibacterales bacterium]
DASEDWLAASGGADEPPAPVAALAAIDALLARHEKPAPAAPANATQTVTSQPAAAMPAEAPLDTLRLNAASLDRIVTSAGQLLTESLRQDSVADALQQISQRLAESASEGARARRGGRRIFQNLDSSPELAPVSRYVNFLDHQMRVLSRQVEVAVRLHARNTWALRALAGELQQDVRRARMVQAENVFGGFRKMVRDLAREAGKTVDLRVSGLQVEADRVVLQALKDPVMHMLRNALAHGVEPEAERKSRGKSPEGRIDLSLEVRGNQLRVSVEDDGRGIDVTRVAEVARRTGLITDADLSSRSAADLMRLVLLPGFSTRESVNELSGRGMGLSVVAQAVTRLQGKIDIEPGSRGGTRVTIAAPLSVSSHRLLLVRCQAQTFAVPLHGIERLQRIALADVQTIESRQVILIDGKTVPVVSLARLVGTDEGAVAASEHSISVMVMRAGAVQLAVAVDAFLSERDAIIKDLPAPADRNPQMSGGILLEDGSVCLVLNPFELLAGFERKAAPLVLADPPTADAPKAAGFEILVVDDSLTTRTLEKSVLEAHGYQVATAVDGVDALHYLRANAVKLVISDIEMPRLDGFGLLEEMKSDPRLSSIPVIVVSSVENPEQQARGMTLGADAYVVKRKFDQHELLETIRQIV